MTPDESDKASSRRYYQNNREKELARQRKWREENLELKRQIMRESARRRRAENPDREKAIQRKCRANESPEQRKNRLTKIREWHRKHQAEMKEYNRKWQAEHPGRKARWREKNPEKARAADDRKKQQARDKRRDYPEIVRAYYRAAMANRKALLIPTEGHHTVADIQSLYDKQDGKCAACQKPFPASGAFRFEVDHIIPLKPRNGGLPGTNGPENLQLLYRKCNRSKGNKHPDEWRPWF